MSGKRLFYVQLFQGKAHNGVETPHVHEPKQPVRPAKPEELPRK